MVHGDTSLGRLEADERLVSLVNNPIPPGDAGKSDFLKTQIWTSINGCSPQIRMVTLYKPFK